MIGNFKKCSYCTNLFIYSNNVRVFAKHLEILIIFFKCSCFQFFVYKVKQYLEISKIVQILLNNLVSIFFHSVKKVFTFFKKVQNFKSCSCFQNYSKFYSQFFFHNFQFFLDLPLQLVLKDLGCQTIANACWLEWQQHTFRNSRPRAQVFGIFYVKWAVRVGCFCVRCTDIWHTGGLLYHHASMMLFLPYKPVGLIFLWNMEWPRIRPATWMLSTPNSMTGSGQLATLPSSHTLSTAKNEKSATC